MTFLEEQIRDSLPVWEACLDTQFLRRLADGTLEEDCLKGYIVDDSLYLREYAKVFAWGMLHSSDMAEIRSYYSLLAFVNESEDATRRYYLRRYGITDEEIQPLPLRPENRAYVDYMIAAARPWSGITPGAGTTPSALSGPPSRTGPAGTSPRSAGNGAGPSFKTAPSMSCASGR